MARAYSLDLRERVVSTVAAGQSCRSAARTFMGEPCERGEVFAAPSRREQPGGAENGRPQTLPAARARDWLLARLAEKPDRRGQRRASRHGPPAQAHDERTAPIESVESAADRRQGSYCDRAT
jgi:transposase